MSEKAWNKLFYFSLLLIPALSIFGRELQSLLSTPHLVYTAEYVISAALVLISFLIVVVGQSKTINWALLFVAAIIFVLVPFHLDRFEERLHFICFGVLAFAAYRSFGLRVSAILVCLVGLGDEVLQHFLPSRVGDWRDVAMNCFAGVSAVLLAHEADK